MNGNKVSAKNVHILRKYGKARMEQGRASMVVQTVILQREYERQEQISSKSSVEVKTYR